MKQMLDREGTGPDRNTADYRIRKAQVEIICTLPSHIFPLLMLLI